jgi:hypothetical protein
MISPKLLQHQGMIHHKFRHHQMTILQLATFFRVGTHTMRTFLRETMEDYNDIVLDLRRKIKQRKHVANPGKLRQLELHRRKSDFSEAELKEIEQRLMERKSQTRLIYHEYIIDPLVGDVDYVDQRDWEV